jgi:hypothetical protein
MLLAGDPAGMYSCRIRRCGKYRSRSEWMVGNPEKASNTVFRAITPVKSRPHQLDATLLWVSVDGVSRE